MTEIQILKTERDGENFKVAVAAPTGTGKGKVCKALNQAYAEKNAAYKATSARFLGEQDGRSVFSVTVEATE